MLYPMDTVAPVDGYRESNTPTPYSGSYLDQYITSYEEFHSVEN